MRNKQNTSVSNEKKFKYFESPKFSERNFESHSHFNEHGDFDFQDVERPMDAGGRLYDRDKDFSDPHDFGDRYDENRRVNKRPLYDSWSLPPITPDYKVAGMHAGKGPKGYIRSDERIMEDICEELTDSPDIDAGEIEVRVKKGVVIFSGTVESRQEIRWVEELAERVPGVRGIRNDLRFTGPFRLTKRKR